MGISDDLGLFATKIVNKLIAFSSLADCGLFSYNLSKYMKADILKKSNLWNIFKIIVHC